MVCFCATVSSTWGPAPLSSGGVWADATPATTNNATSEVEKRTKLILKTRTSADHQKRAAPRQSSKVTDTRLVTVVAGRRRSVRQQNLFRSHLPRELPGSS